MVTADTYLDVEDSKNTRRSKFTTCDRTLLVAARRGDVTATRQALLAGVTQTCLTNLALGSLRTQRARGRYRVLKMLVARGIDLQITNRKGQTPLMETVSAGDRRQVLALLESGADPNFKNEQHETALSYAIVLEENWHCCRASCRWRSSG